MATFLKILPALLKLVGLIFAAWSAGNWGILQQGGGDILKYLIAVLLPGSGAVAAMATASVMDHKRTTKARAQMPELGEDTARHETELLTQLFHIALEQGSEAKQLKIVELAKCGGLAK